MLTQLKNSKTSENIYPVLEDASVNTSTIKDGAVTGDKLADGLIPHLNKYYATLQISAEDTQQVTLFFLTKDTLSDDLTLDDIKAYLSEGDFGHNDAFRDAGSYIAYVCDNSGATPQITYNSGSDEANFGVLVAYGLVKQIF